MPLARVDKKKATNLWWEEEENPLPWFRGIGGNTKGGEGRASTSGAEVRNCRLTFDYFTLKKMIGISGNQSQKLPHILLNFKFKVALPNQFPG